MVEQRVNLRIEALYAHHDWLANWFRGQVREHETAQDLAQDTFVRVVAHQRRDPQEIAAPRAYLRVIARALLINHWRRCDLEHALLETLTALPPEHAPSAQTQAHMLDTLQRLDQALAELPSPVREAFLRTRFEQRTYAEVAQDLGCAVVTVKRYVQRALLQCLLTMDDA